MTLTAELTEQGGATYRNKLKDGFGNSSTFNPTAVNPHKSSRPLNVIRDNAPEGMPGLGLRLVSLPGYTPDLYADEAIWRLGARGRHWKSLPRSLAGKPSAGFCATPSRRIPVLYGSVVHERRCNTHRSIDNRR